MAFTVNDFEDLVGLLAQHPEWRERLRPLVVGDELLGVPSRLDRIEANLEAVTVRLDRLTERVDGLTIAVQRLVERADRAEGRMGNIEGELLESKYDRNVENWLGFYINRPARVSIHALTRVREAVQSGDISPQQMGRLRDLDLLVGGTEPGDGDEILLAIEVSYAIDEDDVRRANAAAEILRGAGYRARGLVGGYRIHPAAETAAAEADVIVDLHRPPVAHPV